MKGVREQGKISNVFFNSIFVPVHKVVLLILFNILNYMEVVQIEVMDIRQICLIPTTESLH